MTAADEGFRAAASARDARLGGVRFAFSGAPVKIDDWTASFLADVRAPVIDRVFCHVSLDERLEHHAASRSVCIHWNEGVAHIRAGRTATDLSRSQRGYEADAQVAPAVITANQLLPSIAAAVLHTHGGLSLHAAGVVVDGRALLFVGPSNAGKTTAARLCRGAQRFTWDRAAAGMTDLGPWAWAMPGGSDSSGSLGPPAMRALPLAGILRVVRGERECRVRTPNGAEAVTLLRESTIISGGGAREELATLDAVTGFLKAVRFGVIETVLDRDASGPVRKWLNGAVKC